MGGAFLVLGHSRNAEIWGVGHQDAVFGQDRESLIRFSLPKSPESEPSLQVKLEYWLQLWVILLSIQKQPEPELRLY